MQRRDFLTASAVAGAGLLTSGAQAASSSKSQPLLKPGDTLLFQGDSITNAGRDHKNREPNSAAALGKGYAFMAASQLMLDHGEQAFKIYNRGVSGHKVFQLAKRWQKDCLDLKPNVVSILIGVNDIWHRLMGRYDGSVETYRQDYLALAERTKQALPEVKLVICQPFTLKVGAVDDSWFPLFDEYKAAAREVADKFGDAWVPFDTLLNQAAKIAPAKTWVRDGVHPSPHGTALMANAWRRAVGV